MNIFENYCKKFNKTPIPEKKEKKKKKKRKRILAIT